MRDEEIISRVGAVRDELFRQMGQFERDKVKSEDDRARGAILGIMEEMAKMAGMSVSIFHHHFKLVTTCSPLQYLKRIRLDRARTLMTLDGYNAGTAAHAVGYESASQFGREFKRLFGVTPVEDAEQMRARLIAG